MELASITMDRNQARVAFAEYRRAVQESLDREARTYDEAKLEVLIRRREYDEAVMRGYRQLALGHQVIVLQDVIRAAGEDKEHRPRLAVARADRTRVHMARYDDGRVQYGQTPQRRDHRNPRTQAIINLPAGTLPRATGLRWGRLDAEAVVPTIPPRFRPAELERYHVLWEAAWTEPPKDPALLRAMGRGLYVVLATWDLTEIERAALGLRMN